jgi:signal transduction histidine kinase
MPNRIIAQKMRPNRPPTQAIAWRGQARRLAALHQAAVALASDLDLERILRQILKTAATLARARFGALGVPDGKGGFAQFLTVGISEARARQIGELPRVHGVLGALLTAGKAIRVKDIRRHPLARGYPAHHPAFREFLGVPIRHRGEILGNLYLAGSRDGAFSATDQRLVEMLAAQAAVALGTARLYAQGHALAVLEERNRIARELHDAVSQTLFSMMYEARAAALKAEHDPAAAEALNRLQHQAGAALSEMRALVYALRPKSLERDGLATTLDGHLEALRRAHGARIDLRVEGTTRLPLEQELALLRIAQEAVHNAIKHAAGAPISVRLRQGRRFTQLIVGDQGPGFDPNQRPRTARTAGLATMRERAAAIGAELEITALKGRGSEVRVLLSHGG